MNKTRRAAIDAAIATLETLRGQIEDTANAVETIRDEEQEYFDVMPEGLQYGDKGQNAEAAISALDDALSPLQDFDIDSIIASLEQAKG